MKTKPLTALVGALVLSTLAGVRGASPKTLPPRPAEAAENARSFVVELQDGRHAEMAGNVLRFALPDGRKAIAPAGKYTTKAGRVMTVGANGIILQQGPVVVSPPASPARSTTTTSVPSTPPPRPPASRNPITLQNGAAAEIAGNTLILITAEGRRSVAPPGTYTTKEGRVLTVAARGLILPRGVVDTSPVDHPATPAPNPSTPPPRPTGTRTAISLQDGGAAEIIGNTLLLISGQGRKSVAPPGKYTTNDGQVLTVTARGAIARRGAVGTVPADNPAEPGSPSEPPHKNPPTGSGPGMGGVFAAANLYQSAAPSLPLLKAGEILPPVRPGVTMLPAKVYKVKLASPTGSHLVASRQAIVHQPFEMVHAVTGQKLDPNAIITLPDSEGHRGKGKKMTVGEFFAAINQSEKSLNDWGMSLRTLPAASEIRTAASIPKISLAQARNSRSGVKLEFTHDAPLGAFLGIKRVDVPEFPMEWLPAPVSMLYSMDWSPLHFMVKHIGGTKKLVWQLASEPFPDAGSDWKTPPGLIKSGEDATPQFQEYPRFQMKGKYAWQKLDLLPLIGVPEAPQQFYVRFIALDAKGEPLAGPSRGLTFKYGKIVQPVVKIPVQEYLPQSIPKLEFPDADSPFGVFVKSRGMGAGFDTVRKMYDGKVTDLSSGGGFIAGVRVYNPLHLIDSSKPVTVEVPMAECSLHLDPIKDQLQFDLKTLDESKFANPLAILNPSSLLEMKEVKDFPLIQKTKLVLNVDQAFQADFEEDFPIYDGITLNLKFSIVCHIGVHGEIRKTPEGLGVEGQAGPYAYASFTASGSVHPPGFVQPHLDATIELIHDDFNLTVSLQPEAGKVAFSGENTIRALKGSAILAVDVMVPSPKKAIKGIWGVITFQDMTPDMPVSWARVWHLDLFNQPDYIVNETTSMFD